jgi:hypothetical protein
VTTSGQPPKVDLTHFKSVDDAIQKAEASSTGFVPLAKRIIQAQQGLAYLAPMFMLSAIARATGLSRGVLEAVRTENPHVAFPLLRSYSEVVLMVLYVRKRPAYLETVMRGPRNLPAGTPGPKSSQAIIAAVGRYAPGAKAVWDELSQMTHFGSLAIWHSWRLSEGPAKPGTIGTISYTTYPQWKKATDPLLACAWLIELSDALTDTLEVMLEDWVPHASTKPAE